MNALSIRPPAPEEIRSLSLLSAAAFYETYAEKNSDSDMLHYTRTHFSEERIRNEIMDPDIHFLVAERNGVLNGYAVIRIYREKEISAGLLRLYVLKDFHRQGIGEKLLAGSIDLAKKYKAKKIFLSVWQENKNAVEFYKAQGFKINGTMDFDWGTGKVDEDFLMEKVL